MCVSRRVSARRLYAFVLMSPSIGRGPDMTIAFEPIEDLDFEPEAPVIPEAQTDPDASWHPVSEYRESCVCTPSRGAMIAAAGLAAVAVAASATATTKLVRRILR